MTIESLFNNVPKLQRLQDDLDGVIQEFMEAFPDSAIAEVVGVLEFLKINCIMAS